MEFRENPIIGRISLKAVYELLGHSSYIPEPDHEKTCLMSYANNKGADQPAHPRSLISACIVSYLDSVMSLVSVTKISSLMLYSVAKQASLSLTWSETPGDTFSHDEAHYITVISMYLNIWFECCLLSRQKIAYSIRYIPFIATYGALLVCFLD